MEFYEYSNNYFSFSKRVHAEVKRAQKKFPEPNKLLGALMEEVGEAARALLKITESNGNPQDVYDELIQVACVAYRLATEGEPDYQYKGTKCHYAGCAQPVAGGPCALCYE